MPLKVSVIIVSFNTKAITLACIDSILSNTQKVRYEIICVDNCSQDGSTQAISKSFPDVKLIVNKSNLGFGFANNQAARLAKGEYLLFLNSDTLLVEDSIANLAGQLDSSPQIGILGCKLINSDHTTQPSAGFFPTLTRIAAWMLFIDDLPLVSSFFPSFHPRNPSWFSNYRHFDWLMGACVMVRAKDFARSGGFDPQMFMYAEEVEWQIRTHKLGLQSIYSPSTQIIHLGGASSIKSGQGYKLINEFKGLSYLYKKHYSSFHQFAFRALIKTGSLLRAVIFPSLRHEYIQAYRQI